MFFSFPQEISILFRHIKPAEPLLFPVCGSVFVVFSLETMYDECIERILSVKTDKNIKQSLRQINYGFWTLIKNFKKLFTDYRKKYIIHFGKVWKKALKGNTI